MGKDVFISYIVPCYNINTYLPRCINSLKWQQIQGEGEIEYILINDGSTDESLSLLKDFAKKDKRAIIINQKNQGVSSTRNEGLKVAKGEYVFFLDGDDFLTDDASQILYDLYNDSEPDIIIPNAFIVHEGKWEEKSEWNVCCGIHAGVYDTIKFAKLVKKLPISFKAYRRDLLIENKIFFDEELKVGEVYSFFLHAMTYSNIIAFTDKRVMNYVVRNDSVMRTVNLERDSLIVKTMHYIDRYARMQMPELLEISSYKQSLYDIVNMFGMSNYVIKSPYTSEIGKFLKIIKRDRIYSKLQKHFLYQDFGMNKKTIYNILLYYFPVSFSYNILRLIYKIRK